MSQDSIVIFRSMIDAIDVLPPELYKEVSRLIYAYAFEGQEPPKDTHPATLALFLSIKPQIDFNVKRYESYVERGKKGGAPKGNSNARKKAKEDEEETSKNNLKQAETTSDNLEQPKTSKNKQKQKKSENKNNLKQPTEKTEGKQVETQEVSESSENCNIQENSELQEEENKLKQPKTSKNNLNQYQYQYNNILSLSLDARTREEYGEFLGEFFSESHMAQIEVLCMQLKTTPDALKTEAAEIVSEWMLTGATHQDYKDTAQHLINQLRVKYRAKLSENGRRQQKEAGTAAAEDRPNEVCGRSKAKKPLRSTV